MPAPGQGAIAIECRADDAETAAAVAPLHHPPTHAAITALRSFLSALGGGCNVPVGGFAEPAGAVGLTLRAFVAREDGSRVLRGERAGAGDPAELGRALAQELLGGGAARLLGR